MQDIRYPAIRFCFNQQDIQYPAKSHSGTSLEGSRSPLRDRRVSSLKHVNSSNGLEMTTERVKIKDSTLQNMFLSLGL